MLKKYFLYIDILGFSELVRSGSEKIPKLFAAMDLLNIHTDLSIKTIVFSDTIISFNLDKPEREEFHSTFVMYFCEYAQDLMQWCTKLDIQFKAILLYADMHYEAMNNFDAYYGNALIDAYYKEKKLDVMGLFIANDLVHLSDVFHTTPFDDDLSFVFLTQKLEYFKDLGGELPLPWELVIDGSMFLWSELDILKRLKEGIDKYDVVKVKEKYIRTYQVYKDRYGAMLDKLEAGNFDLRVVNDRVDWDEIRDDWWDLEQLNTGKRKLNKGSK